MEANKKLGTWSKTKLNTMKHKAVIFCSVFDIKHDAEGKMTSYKARFVAQDFKQVPGGTFDETWAPGPKAATTISLFAVAAAKSWEVHDVDVKTAFLNANLEKELYIKPSDSIEPERMEKMGRPNLALYRKKQAGRLWGTKLEKELKGLGAVRSKVDPCLYEWHHPVHGSVFILLYVDDLIVAEEKLAGVDAFKRSVSAMFDVRDMGEVYDFIGMKVIATA